MVVALVLEADQTANVLGGCRPKVRLVPLGVAEMFHGDHAAKAVPRVADTCAAATPERMPMSWPMLRRSKYESKVPFPQRAR